MSLTMDDMTPIQRAAAILVALGPEISSKVMKNLSDSEVEAITLQIANLTDIPAKVEEEVVKYVSEIFLAKKFVNKGGVDYARKLLEQSFGSNKASSILKRLEGVITSKGFDLMKDIDAKQLQSFIQNELPQTIALILSQLNSTQAAQILTEFQPELQAEVSYRIATMEKISPEVFKEIEGVLESHFEPTGAADVSVSGGTKTIADILNLVETSSEKGIMESIEAENPELASEIKNLMFVFEDIVLLDNRSVQRVLKDVESKDLSIALKASSDEVKEKIFSNVSERVATMIQEEMEFAGPMRLSDVEAAQQRVVETIRRLQDEGQIIVSGRGGKDEIIV